MKCETAPGGVRPSGTRHWLSIQGQFSASPTRPQPPRKEKKGERKVGDKMQRLMALVERDKAEAEREEKKPSQAEALVMLASEADLFHTPDNKAFGTLPVNGHRETWSLRSNGFRRWLTQRFYDKHGKPPGGQAMSDALSLLEATAQFRGPEENVFVRVAAHNGNVYLDLGGADWQAVEVTPTGWRVVSDPPVRFVRGRASLALPRPVPGGSLEELRLFVNLPGEGRDDGTRDDYRFVLAVAWALGALRGVGPYPLLDLIGEQGSAKSTTARVLRSLIDPATAPLRSAPRDERELMVQAMGSRILAFDNLSGLEPWLSDSFCRISTGGGGVVRELYSDSEEVIFEATRRGLLTGIIELATAPDLLDRALVVDCPRLTNYRTEDELWHQFEEAKPRVLGALLDAVSAGLRNLPSTRLPNAPRLADFATWVVACEEALPWPRGTFMAAYTRARRAAVESTLDADPVAVALRNLLASREEWGGTATELLERLGEEMTDLPDVKRSHAWPKTPKALSNRLRRVAPDLRLVGLAVEFVRQHGGRRLVSVRKLASPSSPPSQPYSDAGFLGDANQAASSPRPAVASPPIDQGVLGDGLVTIGRRSSQATVTHARPWESSKGGEGDASDARLRLLSNPSRDAEEEATRAIETLRRTGDEEGLLGLSREAADLVRERRLGRWELPGGGGHGA